MEIVFNLYKKAYESFAKTPKYLGGKYTKEAIEQLLSLLTSEVEKERERLLEEVEKAIFKGGILMEVNGWKKYKRKALSDIGGGKI